MEAAGTQSGQVSQGGASRSDAPAAAPTDIDTTGARTFNRDSQQSGAAVQPEPEAPAADTPQTGQQRYYLFFKNISVLILNILVVFYCQEQPPSIQTR